MVMTKWVLNGILGFVWVVMALYVWTVVEVML